MLAPISITQGLVTAISRLRQQKKARGHQIGPGRRSILTLHRRVAIEGEQNRRRYPYGYSYAEEDERRRRQVRTVRLRSPDVIAARHRAIDKVHGPLFPYDADKLPASVSSKITADLDRIFDGYYCWSFAGKWNDGKGYKKVQVKGVASYVHRYVYEALVGPIADGLILDHLCRNPGCCNPRHLEPVTVGTNTRRGDAVLFRAAA